MKKKKSRIEEKVKENKNKFKFNKLFVYDLFKPILLIALYYSKIE